MKTNLQHITAVEQIERGAAPSRSSLTMLVDTAAQIFEIILLHMSGF